MTKKGVPSLTHVDIYSKAKEVHFTSLETDPEDTRMGMGVEIDIR